MSSPTVAIIGASADRTKFGNKSVRAHLAQGYEVFPINPKAEIIEGLQSYPNLAEVPETSLDRISLYVPPSVGLGLVEEIVAKGCKELWLNPGSESEALASKLREQGIEPIIACSIVDVGVSPHDLQE